MQVATAKHKPEPHPTASAGSAFQPRTQVAGSGLGAGAGMPAFLQRKGKGNDKSHATAMDSDPPQGQLGPDEEELLVPIQKKMVIGAADDPLEREADDVARSATTQPAATQTAALQRKEGGQEACSCGGTCSACASQGFGCGGARTANRAPSRSSQARVGSKKKLAVGPTRVA